MKVFGFNKEGQLAIKLTMDPSISPYMGGPSGYEHITRRRTDPLSRENFGDIDPKDYEVPLEKGWKRNYRVNTRMNNTPVKWENLSEKIVVDPSTRKTYEVEWRENRWIVRRGGIPKVREVVVLPKTYDNVSKAMYDLSRGGRYFTGVFWKSIRQRGVDVSEIRPMNAQLRKADPGTGMVHVYDLQLHKPRKITIEAEAVDIIRGTDSNGRSVTYVFEGASDARGPKDQNGVPRQLPLAEQMIIASKIAKNEDPGELPEYLEGTQPQYRSPQDLGIEFEREPEESEGEPMKEEEKQEEQENQDDSAQQPPLSPPGGPESALSRNLEKLSKVEVPKFDFPLLKDN